MELFLAILMFVAGMILIIKGGDWFVDSATWIAKTAKIPSFIIGATIVGFATSLPEIIVSIVASVQGKNDMAVGNGVGSVIANTGLIIAIAFSFMKIVTPRKEYWQQCLLLVATLVVLWVGSLQGTLNILASIIMILICITFIAISIIQGRRGISSVQDQPKKVNGDETVSPLINKSENEIIATSNANSKPDSKNNEIVINKKNIFKNIFFFFLGAACVILGSDFLIDGGSTIASALGVPERIIAITLVAVGTSLPELVTTIVAIRKKEGGLMAGNIIGSNIIDMCLILPICSFVAHDSFVVSHQSLVIDMPFCLALSLILVVPILFKQRSYKWQGALLLLVYAAYLTVSFVA